jgi:hypothetical protein
MGFFAFNRGDHNGGAGGWRVFPAGKMGKNLRQDEQDEQDGWRIEGQSRNGEALLLAAAPFYPVNPAHPVNSQCFNRMVRAWARSSHGSTESRSTEDEGCFMRKESYYIGYFLFALKYPLL